MPQSADFPLIRYDLALVRWKLHPDFADFLPHDIVTLVFYALRLGLEQNLQRRSRIMKRIALIATPALCPFAAQADGHGDMSFVVTSEGVATVGHHERTGGGPDPTSWRASNNPRGCSQEALVGTCGSGLFHSVAT